MNLFDRPILIAGCRRSGTTLLQAILSEHPNLKVHPQEVQFFLEMSQRFGTEIRDVPAAIDFVCAHPYCAENLTPDKIRGVLRDGSPMPLREFARGYLQAWAEEITPGQRIVLKHPRLILHLDLVFNLFPEAGIIHIVRDPRGNIASQRARWPKATLHECVAWWRNSVHSGKALALTNPDACLEIRYEDLVVSPETTLQKVCEFTGVAFTESLLNFELITQDYQPDQDPARKTYIRVDPSRLDRWHKNLTDVEICLIENACRHEMTWWNYPLMRPKVSLVRLAGRDISDRISYTIQKFVKMARQAVQRAHSI